MENNTSPVPIGPAMSGSGVVTVMEAEKVSVTGAAGPKKRGEYILKGLVELYGPDAAPGTAIRG